MPDHLACFALVLCPSLTKVSNTFSTAHLKTREFRELVSDLMKLSFIETVVCATASEETKALASSLSIQIMLIENFAKSENVSIQSEKILQWLLRNDPRFRQKYTYALLWSNSERELCSPIIETTWKALKRSQTTKGGSASRLALHQHAILPENTCNSLESIIIPEVISVERHFRFIKLSPRKSDPLQAISYLSLLDSESFTGHQKEAKESILGDYKGTSIIESSRTTYAIENDSGNATAADGNYPQLPLAAYAYPLIEKGQGQATLQLEPLSFKASAPFTTDSVGAALGTITGDVPCTGWLFSSSPIAPNIGLTSLLETCSRESAFLWSYSPPDLTSFQIGYEVETQFFFFGSNDGDEWQSDEQRVTRVSENELTLKIPRAADCPAGTRILILLLVQGFSLNGFSSLLSLGDRWIQSSTPSLSTDQGWNEVHTSGSLLSLKSTGRVIALRGEVLTPVEFDTDPLLTVPLGCELGVWSGLGFIGSDRSVHQEWTTKEISFDTYSRLHSELK